MGHKAESKLEAFETFLKAYPSVRYIPPTASDFPSLRTTYILFDKPAVPLAIVRPQTAEDVAAIVSYSTANDIPFTVRSGGNNIFGLSCVQGALMIDMRECVFPSTISLLLRASQLRAEDPNS